MNILRGSVIGLAGVIGGGVLAWPAVTNADTTDQSVLYKRDERAVDLVLADDEDGDDTNDRTQDRLTRGDVTNNVTNGETRNDVTNGGTRNDATNNVTNAGTRNDATNDGTRDATS